MNNDSGFYSTTRPSMADDSTGGIPKPGSCAAPRPPFSSRLLQSGKSCHGGYSPGFYSPQQHSMAMSPVSCLTYDFRELNTSQEAGTGGHTPRKRLSLSSASSADSPFTSSLASPALTIHDGKRQKGQESTVSSSSSSDQPFLRPPLSPAPRTRKVARKLRDVITRHPMTSLACSSSVFEPIQSDGDNLFLDPAPCAPAPRLGDSPCPRMALQQLDSNCLASESGGGIPLKRNVKLVNKPRLHSGKENATSRRQTFRRCQLDSPANHVSPLAFNTISNSPLPVISSHPGAMMTSSPMLVASSHSAFSTVRHDMGPVDDVGGNRRVQSPPTQLNSLRPPQSRTPEKSSVPRVIASFVARRPPAASSFFRRVASTSPSDVDFEHRGAALKRSLDSSVNCASKRPKCDAVKRPAFGARERKSKSDDMMSCRHQTALKCSSFRPISAPAQMLRFDDDDDAPLSTSRLCSTDSDCDDDGIAHPADVTMTSEEKLLAEMTSASETTAPPAGLEGLLSGALLMSSSKDEKPQNSSSDFTLSRPRELFRSPSAPPLGITRRNLNLVKRSRRRDDLDSTPVAPGKREPSVSEEEELENLPEAGEELDELNSSLNRSRSVNELDIMRAVDRGSNDRNLIGDFSRSCSLDTVSGKHQDLKYILPNTLVDLMNRQQAGGTVDYDVIDCRYPYEHEGGHVRDSINIWKEDDLFKRYFESRHPKWAQPAHYRPPVLIFYCEFSSERGPRMARSLRCRDRELNRYPHLHYPELYIIKDGYKGFFEQTAPSLQDYCTPRSYRPMLHQDFTRDMRMCRVKCKTWEKRSEKTRSCNFNSRSKSSRSRHPDCME